MDIVTTVGTREGQKVLTLKGPLTIHTIFDFQSAVREQSTSALIIDFSNVPFMDSAGLGALVGARVALQKANRPLAIAALNTQVKALLDMSKVSPFFRIFSTVEEAQGALA
ncbi:MAG TPA: STAS domain-containing protein [Candidatus Baltobacteraceae bacterium]|nr:STAS domain-containing protein [Candidatus Baltobacteraceae bacterium]